MKQISKIALLTLLICLSVTSCKRKSPPTARVGAGMPTLSFIAPTSAFVNEAQTFDARRSTGVSQLPQSDGSPSITIDFGDGYDCNLPACGHAYRQAGTYTITVTGKDAAGTSAATTRSITISEVPAATGANVQLLPNTGNVTTNGANLQTAVNLAATRNDAAEQEIVLPVGAKFGGEIVFKNPVGSKYITIRSANTSSLPAGKRVFPTDIGNMASILSVNGGQAFRGEAGVPTNHYRLQGLHIGQVDSTIRVHHLSSIGMWEGPYELETLAHHWIVDRCYFDGGPNDTDQIRTGTTIYGDHHSIVDSYFGDFRLIGSGVDTQAFGVSFGQGPYAFWNNTAIAGSENVNLSAGGAAYYGLATISNATNTTVTLSHIKNLEVDMGLAMQVNGLFHPANFAVVKSISGNTITFVDPIPNVPQSGGKAAWSAIPSFIEFRQNHLYKPLKWRPTLADGSPNPEWNGQHYQIKNLWESKFARYVLCDGNRLEGTWVAHQAWAIAISIRNRSGGESESAEIRQMQWTNNIIKDAPNGWNISATDDCGDQGNCAGRASDFTFRNNLLWNVGADWDGAGSHAFINIGGAEEAYKIRRIFIINNTHDNGPRSEWGFITAFSEPGGAIDAVWKNNVHQHCEYGFGSSLNMVDSDFNIRRYLPPGDATNWDRNLIVNTGGRKYPAAAIIQDGVSWASQFVDYNAGNFTLVPGSPGKNAGLDGKDVGVDMVKLTYATRGCVSGVWDGSAPPPTPSPTATQPPSPSPTSTVTPTPVPSPTPQPSPSPGVVYEFAKFTVFFNETKFDQQMATVGDSGYGQCNVYTSGVLFYCLRPKGVMTKYEWKKWTWPNGQSQRDALLTEVGNSGYSNVIIWNGRLRASRPRS
jgi:hypothetical protein